MILVIPRLRSGLSKERGGSSIDGGDWDGSVQTRASVAAGDGGFVLPSQALCHLSRLANDSPM
jgi:hypothetical protein